jgi:hypothetical protein
VQVFFFLSITMSCNLIVMISELEGRKVNMRMLAVVMFLSAAATLTILDTLSRQQAAPGLFQAAALRGDWPAAADALQPQSYRDARQLSQAAITMELAGRIEEADYLYSEAVQAAGEQYGHSHTITESYRQRHLAFFATQEAANSTRLTEASSVAAQP